MPIRFYIHTPVEDMNERRALCRIARLLHEQYASTAMPAVAVIANVNPPREAYMTQVDCVIISEQCVALVDFKNYPAPFDGAHEHRPWFIRGTDVMVRGGSTGGVTSNPFQQARRAHRRWIEFFADHAMTIVQSGQRINWGHLNGFVLFHPFLNPDSTLPQHGNWQKWLSFASVDDVVDLLFSSKSSIRLTENEVWRFAEQAFEAYVWHDIESLLRDHVGYLTVAQPDDGAVAFPLWRYDELSLGRSRHNRIRVAPPFVRVSGTHLLLSTTGHSLTITDISDGNRTFVNGALIEPHVPHAIKDRDEIVCGELGMPESCALRFTRNSPLLNHPKQTLHTEKTLLDNS